MEKNLLRLLKYICVAGMLFVFKHFMGFELAILLGLAFINVDISEDK